MNFQRIIGTRASEISDCGHYLVTEVVSAGVALWEAWYRPHMGQSRNARVIGARLQSQAAAREACELHKSPSSPQTTGVTPHA